MVPHPTQPDPYCLPLLPAGSEGGIAAFIDAFPAGVVVLDGHGTVERANPAAQQLLGEPLGGIRWSEVIARAFDPHAVGSHLRLRSNRYVTLSTSPMPRGAGQIVMLQDVTETHLLQELLHRQQRLVEMGRMSASLAHQIRTPLATALLYASRLAEGGLAEASRERFAERVVESLQGLESLIRQMLLFSGAGGASREPVAAATLLQEVVSANRELLERTQTHCEIIDESAGSALLVNRVVVLSALQNLLVNAVQAMGQAGRLQLVALSGEPDTVELLVRDYGPGIDPAQQAHLFEPLATSRAEGTGLGLAVVQAVARSHGGEAWCRSRPGEGSTFGITLPRLRGNTDAEPAPRDAVRAVG